ncbi:MAG: hypothetical protein AB7G12_06030 [Thermoanaerobaculia bacterium]
MSRRERTAAAGEEARQWRPLLLLVAVWLLLGELAAPQAIAWLYAHAPAGEGGGLVARAAAGLRGYPTLADCLGAWRTTIRWLLVGVVGYRLFASSSRGAGFAARFVPPASAGMLGAIRAWVSFVLLVSAVWEDLPSSALLPRAMWKPEGVLRLFDAAPIGFGSFLTAPFALALFQGVTIVLLVAALLGFRTRWSVPLAALSYLVFAGIFRSYAWFYHTGLVPMYLLFVLSFTPCGDGFSLDRWLGGRARRSAGADDAAVPLPDPAGESVAYGWARFLVWTALALPYVEAGLSKLRRAGVEWTYPENLKSLLLMDTLNPMQFDWSFSLRLVHAPDALFWLFGIGTIVAETSFGLVLFSARARRLLPLLTIGMHLSIWVLQNVLFFDLVLLQAIFYDWRPAKRWLLARLRRPAPAGPRALAPAFEATGGAVAIDWPRRFRLLVALFVTLWVVRLEEYPLTAMQMYSNPNLTGRVDWYAVRATYASGEEGKAPVEAAIPALRDARYRRIVRHGFRPATEPVAKEFLRAVGRAWNRTAAPGERITALRVERWSWDYAHQPDDPRHGSVAASYGVDLTPELAEHR